MEMGYAPPKKKRLDGSVDAKYSRFTKKNDETTGVMICHWAMLSDGQMSNKVGGLSTNQVRFTLWWKLLALMIQLWQVTFQMFWRF